MSEILARRFTRKSTDALGAMVFSLGRCRGLARAVLTRSDHNEHKPAGRKLEFDVHELILKKGGKIFQNRSRDSVVSCAGDSAPWTWGYSVENLWRGKPRSSSNVMVQLRYNESI